MIEIKYNKYSITNKQKFYEKYLFNKKSYVIKYSISAT